MSWYKNKNKNKNQHGNGIIQITINLVLSKEIRQQILFLKIFNLTFYLLILSNFPVCRLATI